MLYTKWDWISRGCALCGLENSALIAKELDTSISKLYMERYTTAWIALHRCFNVLDKGSLLEVAQCVAFCVPCEIRKLEKASCAECRLAKHDEVCLCEHSLFQKFLNTFTDEIDFAIIDLEMPC